MILDRVNWSGRLEEPNFLARIYDLAALPSSDSRFKDAYGDIYQHRVNNYDWEDSWIFADTRFGLARSDEYFLRFLAETLHPVVRTDDEERDRLLEMYNSHLRRDGWNLIEVANISGYPIYAARELLTVPAALEQIEETVSLGDMAHLSRQITRMSSTIETDPDLAIGTAKELVETCCRTILAGLNIEPSKNWSLSKLVRETSAALKVTPDSVAEDTKGAAAIRQILGSLGTVVSGIGELRNQYGTGHGRAVKSAGLGPRHARLVVGAASTLVAFLFETFEYHQERGSL